MGDLLYKYMTPPTHTGYLYLATYFDNLFELELDLALAGRTGDSVRPDFFIFI